MIYGHCVSLISQNKRNGHGERGNRELIGALIVIHQSPVVSPNVYHYVN